MKTIVTFAADTHPNDRVGLCPPEITLDGVGSPGKWVASTLQQESWNAWTQFWGQQGVLKKELDAQLYAVLDGDGSDDNEHGKAGLITTNKADALKIAQAVLEPMRAVADKWFMVRGTQAHAGEFAWMEEELAATCGAEPDEEAGTASWWWLPLNVEGVSFHVGHVPPTFGSKPWTIDAALGRCSKEIRDEYLERGDLPPDVAVFAHHHVFRDSGMVKKPYVVFLPGWQYMTAYGILRRGWGGFVRPIGGAWFICENGDWQFDYHIWTPKRKREWKAS